MKINNTTVQLTYGSEKDFKKISTTVVIPTTRTTLNKNICYSDIKGKKINNIQNCEYGYFLNTLFDMFETKSVIKIPATQYLTENNSFKSMESNNYDFLNKFKYKHIQFKTQYKEHKTIII